MGQRNSTAASRAGCLFRWLWHHTANFAAKGHSAHSCTPRCLRSDRGAGPACGGSVARGLRSRSTVDDHRGGSRARRHGASPLGHADTLWAYIVARSGWKGVPVVRQAIDLADGRSASPQESRLRVFWMLDVGLPRPLVNWPVYDADGHLLGIADLLDVEAGLVAEYDGSEHRGLKRHTDDNAREEGFERVGLTVVRATSLDLGRRQGHWHSGCETAGRAECVATAGGIAGGSRSAPSRRSTASLRRTRSQRVARDEAVDLGLGTRTAVTTRSEAPTGSGSWTSVSPATCGSFQRPVPS